MATKVKKKVSRMAPLREYKLVPVTDPAELAWLDKLLDRRNKAAGRRATGRRKAGSRAERQQ